MSGNRVVYSRFSPLGRLLMSIVGVALFVVFAVYLYACLEAPTVYRSRSDRSAPAARQRHPSNQLDQSDQPDPSDQYHEQNLTQQVASQSASAAAQVKWLSFCVLGVPSLVLALFNLYFVGPNHIALDFDRRQITSVSGFPLIGKRIQNDFADIEGLRLTGGKYQNPSVVLVWKQPGRSFTLLQSFPNEKAAREMMRSLSSMLEVSYEA